MARPLILLAATASAALLAAPAMAQDAAGAGLRFLSWPGHSGSTAQPSASETYGLRGPAAEVTRTSASPTPPRRPDRYSGGGSPGRPDTRYYDRQVQQRQAAQTPAPPPVEQPRYQPPQVQQPQVQQQQTYAPPPQPQPTYQPTWQSQPQPQPRAEERPLPQAQPQQQAQQQPPSQQPQAAPTGDGVRYYSVHRGSGRTPDPIQQTYVAPADAMVALAPPSGDSLAERQRQATAEETALDLIRQLPPDQLALLLDNPQ